MMLNIKKIFQNFDDNSYLIKNLKIKYNTILYLIFKTF